MSIIFSFVVVFMAVVLALAIAAASSGPQGGFQSHGAAEDGPLELGHAAPLVAAAGLQ